MSEGLVPVADEVEAQGGDAAYNEALLSEDNQQVDADSQTEDNLEAKQQEEPNEEAEVEEDEQPQEASEETDDGGISDETWGKIPEKFRAEGKSDDEVLQAVLKANSELEKKLSEPRQAEFTDDEKIVLGKGQAFEDLQRRQDTQNLTQFTIAAYHGQVDMAAFNQWYAQQYKKPQTSGLAERLKKGELSDEDLDKYLEKKLAEKTAKWDERERQAAEDKQKIAWQSEYNSIKQDYDITEEQEQEFIAYFNDPDNFSWDLKMNKEFLYFVAKNKIPRKRKNAKNSVDKNRATRRRRSRQKPVKPSNGPLMNTAGDPEAYDKLFDKYV